MKITIETYANGRLVNISTVDTKDLPDYPHVIRVHVDGPTHKPIPETKP